MKSVALFAVLTLATATSARARDIKTGVATQITGTLTVENGSDLFISTRDFIAVDQRYPATHIGVWPCEPKSSGHYESLLKVARTGQQVTIRGFFRPITGRAAVGMDIPYAFCLTEQRGSRRAKDAVCLSLGFFSQLHINTSK
jgi:hypothetical protein